MTSDITVVGIFIALLLMCLFTDKLSSNQLAVTFLYYASTMIFASLFWGQIPAWSIHAIYALLAAPFIFISGLYGAATILCYLLFNLVVSYDYMYYLTVDTIVSVNFIPAQLFFAFLMILGSALKGKNNDCRVADYTLDCLGRCKNFLGGLQEVEKTK
ncbi:hypothetical protein JLT2_28 [Paraglaciecola Antarctic JLT virus 2]|nr:hypothetical protein JLT2_28 [Paraglaciecola Antarctic JLT virus 2]